MEVVQGLDALAPSSRPAFLVVGVFDGLHLGHAYLLRHLVEEARRRDARAVVITFDHHPDEILVGGAPPLLCDPDERLERMAAAGVDVTIVVQFDQRLRETPYEAFVATIAARARIAGFLMTPEAAFGYQRGGTPDALAVLGEAQGFEVVVVPSFTIDSRPVSSSGIRTAIATGDLADARLLLGRPHAVVGDAVAVGEGTEVRFALPVALPPTGWYRACVRSPDAGLERGDGPGEHATVADRVVLLPGNPASRRLRVAFLEAG